MRRLVCIGLAVSWLPLLAHAQPPPTMTAQFLGEANHVNSMNDAGDVVGWAQSGNARAFVAGPDRPYELLPLPTGMASSVAEHINDAGVIVGAVSPAYFPDYYLQAKAVSWTPDGEGGWIVTLLGQLPGHVSSKAMAINNLGDIVGYSYNGMFRLPVLFESDGPFDLSSTGIFDPCDVNDQRIVVDQSFTAKRLDLNTMIVDDLGVPLGSYMATRAEAINDAGVVAGAAILATSSNCNHQAARHTDAGWEILSICGQNNSAYDINDLGDVIMTLNVAVYVNLTGIGTYRVEDLISTADGQWFVINSYGNAINGSRQIALMATNPTTGQSGAILLTPEGATAAFEGNSGGAISFSVSPNPFHEATTIRFDASRAHYARVTVHDVSGRLLRTLTESDLPAKTGSVSWDGRDAQARDLPSGVYFARISMGSEVATQKVIKLR